MNMDLQSHSSPRPKHCVCTRSLAEAYQDVVYRSSEQGEKLSAETIATRIGVSLNTLYAWATDPTNEGERHRCPPVSRVVALTLASSNYAVLEYLARESRCSRPIPKLRPLSTPEALGFESLIAMGQGIETLGEGLAEGKFSTEQRRETRMVLRKLQVKLDALASALSQEHGAA